MPGEGETEVWTNRDQDFTVVDSSLATAPTHPRNKKPDSSVDSGSLGPSPRDKTSAEGGGKARCRADVEDEVTPITASVACEA